MTYVKVCLECGSTDTTIPNAGLDIKMTIKDKCRKCGQIGNFPEVEIKQLANFRKEFKNEKTNERSFLPANKLALNVREQSSLSKLKISNFQLTSENTFK